MVRWKEKEKYRPVAVMGSSLYVSSFFRNCAFLEGEKKLVGLTRRGRRRHDSMGDLSGPCGGNGVTG